MLLFSQIQVQLLKKCNQLYLCINGDATISHPLPFFLSQIQSMALADQVYLKNLKKELESLKGSQNDDLDGGLLDAALDKLENEFRLLLTENSVSLLMLIPLLHICLLNLLLQPTTLP
jgi:hypothetical protein